MPPSTTSTSGRATARPGEVLRGCVASSTTAPRRQVLGAQQRISGRRQQHDQVGVADRVDRVCATVTSTSAGDLGGERVQPRSGARDERQARACRVAGEQLRDRRADASACADDGDVRPSGALRHAGEQHPDLILDDRGRERVAVRHGDVGALAQCGSAGGHRRRECAEADHVRAEADRAVDRLTHPAPAALDVGEQVPRTEGDEDHMADGFAADLHARHRHRRQRQAAQGGVVERLGQVPERPPERGRDLRRVVRAGGR